MLHRIYLTIILLLFTQTIFAHPTPTNTFITLADIHFDPFVGCDQLPTPCPLLNELRITSPASWNLIFQKYADHIKTRYHRDTDYRLLQSTLTELKTLNQQQPTFILILGDFLAHQFPQQYKQYAVDTSEAAYQAFVKDVFIYLTDQFNQAAPNTDIYPVIGNNDSYHDDYGMDPHGLFFKDLNSIFATFIKDHHNQEKFQQAFANSGYYAVTLHHKKQRLIVLNSVLFSALHQTPAMQKAAIEQLAWLEAQLNQAKQKHQRVLLALHIPPGVDVYRSIKMHSVIIRYFWPPLFWQPSYNEQFLSLLQQYATTIVGLLPAHIHSDAFQLFMNKADHSFIPLSITPSISPVFGNNPGIKVFSYDTQTFDLINYDTYFYPLNEKKRAVWKHEYNFNAVYQPDCQACLLVNGMRRLTRGNALVTAYQTYYAVSQDAQPITTTWMPYWCAIYHADWASYKACL